jgi:hypothetical protein
MLVDDPLCSVLGVQSILADRLAWQVPGSGDERAKLRDGPG